jgi:DNA-binding transcriptional MerR regulator
METTDKDLTVGVVAKLAGVSVRTLHHYDEIGLLTPSGRSYAGYRTYNNADLARLQLVLLYRELGFPLDEIAALLEDNADRIKHLQRHREKLIERIARLGELVNMVDREMEAQRMDIRLTPEERFEVWGEFDPEPLAAETRDRWGSSDAYRESSKRTSLYTKDDWLNIKADSRRINDAMAHALRAGKPADSKHVVDLAEQHRRHIIRWFYPCSHEMHLGLGEMYVTDPRFEENYERLEPGLATYFRDAINANARPHHEQ